MFPRFSLIQPPTIYDDFDSFMSSHVTPFCLPDAGLEIDLTSEKNALEVGILLKNMPKRDGF